MGNELERERNLEQFQTAFSGEVAGTYIATHFCSFNRRSLVLVHVSFAYDLVSRPGQLLIWGHRFYGRRVSKACPFWSDFILNCGCFHRPEQGRMYSSYWRGKCMLEITITPQKVNNPVPCHEGVLRWVGMRYPKPGCLLSAWEVRISPVAYWDLWGCQTPHLSPLQTLFSVLWDHSLCSY